MSLGIVINGPEGVVLAADSRLTITVQLNNQPPIHASFDNATKLLSFESDCHQHVGAVTYGQAAIGLRTAHSYMPEFEQSLPNERLTIIDYATKLSKFFLVWLVISRNQEENIIEISFIKSRLLSSK